MSDEQYTVSETGVPVGAALALYAIDALDTAVARLGTVVESLGIDVAPLSTTVALLCTGVSYISINNTI